MAHLEPLPRDPTGRVVCSECLRRNRASLDAQYLFEFADHVAYDADEFQLYGTLGALQRKSISGPTMIPMLDVSAEAVLMCRSCHYAAAAQRIPGTLLQPGEAIEPMRAFSAKSGEEVDVPPGRPQE